MPLTKTDAHALMDQIHATAELLGHELRDTAVTLMVRDLKNEDRADVEQALTRCRQELRGRLTLVEIRDRLQSTAAWLSANEAWGIALRSTDEDETLVWCDEIGAAMENARPILEAGDRVGARMAFIAAYDREMQAARAAGRTPQFRLSLGHDPARREDAAREAIERGLLTHESIHGTGDDNPMLPPPQRESTPTERANASAMIDQLRSILGSNREAAEQQRADAARSEEQRRRHLIEQAEQSGATR